MMQFSMVLKNFKQITREEEILEKNYQNLEDTIEIDPTGENKDEFIKKQMEDAIEKTGDLMDAFDVTYQKGRVDLFWRWIEEQNLQRDMIANSFEYLVFHIGEKEMEKKKCFKTMIEEKGLDYLKKIYGQGLGDKIKELYQKRKINYMDISFLTKIDREMQRKVQADVIEKLADLYLDGNLMIGVHRTGGMENAGKNISAERLNLTGDISSGVKVEHKNIKDKLAKNITFIDSLGFMTRELVASVEYKNHDQKLIDNIIIAIPKEELKRENSQIIIKDEGQERLDPKFIAGYVVVDCAEKVMQEYVENSKSIINKKSVATWLKRFQGWKDVLGKSQYPRKKAELMSEISENLKDKTANQQKQEVQFRDVP